MSALRERTGMTGQRWLIELRQLWRTLRFRWACWNALLVALTALVTLLGLRQGVWWALVHELDDILTEDAREVSLMLSELPEFGVDGLGETLNRKASGHARHGWFVELLDGQARPVWNSAAAPLSELELLETTARTPVTVGRLRVVQVPVTVEGAELSEPQTNLPAVSLIRVGASLERLHSDMNHIDRLVGIVAGLVLIAAPVAGYWLAGRAARNVGQIINTAARLRPSHLNERLPVRGSGDELDRLAITVNRLLDRIHVDLQQKRDLLANAAHELRTPLAVIRSSVEVALAGERTREEYQDLLVDIIDQNASLEILVNQLLLLSESESENIRQQGELVSIHDVVGKSVSMFQGVAESRGIRLKTGDIEPAMVQGNRDHLRQVVNNLIDNAIKYTPADGRVSVHLARDDENHFARLVVSDTGEGIAEQDQSRVFERFFRADRSRSRDGGPVGTGLGLSICQAVVQAHGGTIECQSQLGHGTRMTVTLPIPAQPAGLGTIQHE